MYGLRHSVHNVFKGAVEAVTPVLASSQFEEKRLLTPDEFVKAGDYLTSLCGSWSWSGGDAKKRVSYLPDGKQFLVTRGVPCRVRASTLHTTEELVGEEGDEWVSTGEAWNSGGAKKADAAIADISESPGAPVSLDDVPDMDDLTLDEPADDAEYCPQPEGGAQGSTSHRTYDLYITYDKYYQVPRFWLVGFSDDNLPLATKQMLEDVSAEHADKTITVDAFPHVATLKTASIHPCKHAHVMKILGDQIVANGSAFPVDHYLVLFLKFIASVIPTIEYDYTTSLGTSN